VITIFSNNVYALYNTYYVRVRTLRERDLYRFNTTLHPFRGICNGSKKLRSLANVD